MTKEQVFYFTIIFLMKLFHECLVSSPVSLNNFLLISFTPNITKGPTINNPYLNIIIIIIYSEKETLKYDVYNSD